MRTRTRRRRRRKRKRKRKERKKTSSSSTQHARRPTTTTHGTSSRLGWRGGCATTGRGTWSSLRPTACATTSTATATATTATTATTAATAPPPWSGSSTTPTRGRRCSLTWPRTLSSCPSTPTCASLSCHGGGRSKAEERERRRTTIPSWMALSGQLGGVCRTTTYLASLTPHGMLLETAAFLDHRDATSPHVLLAGGGRPRSRWKNLTGSPTTSAPVMLLLPI